MTSFDIDNPICQIGNGIEVRSPRDEDAPSLCKHGSDLKVWSNLSDRMPQPYTLQDARDWIALSRHTSTFAPSGDSCEDRTALLRPSQYVIVIDGVVCGTIGLVFQSGWHRLNANLGYWLGTVYQKRGVMSQVVPAFVAWTWSTFGYLVRLDGTAFEFNIGSQKVLRKAGFVDEGIRINSCIKLGVIHNEVCLAALRPGVEAFRVEKIEMV